MVTIQVSNKDALKVFSILMKSCKFSELRGNIFRIEENAKDVINKIKKANILYKGERKMRLEVQKPYVSVNWVNDWVELEAFENSNDENALIINIVLSDEQGRYIWYELNKKYSGKVKGQRVKGK